MKRATIFALGVAAIIGAAAAVAIYANWNAFVPIAAMGINYFRYLNAPAGELTVETAPGFDGANPAAAVRSPPPDDGLWPSYNKTLASDRFSSLNEINRENADRLKVLCTYDTHQYTGFNSGLLMVDGALLFATEHDTYSIDPITCREKWHKHESYAPATPQPVNRGVAYLDGRVFRGTQDGRVLAYDFKTGERLWETAIADPSKSESAPAAPIAWNDLVFIGNAGGDFKGVKGRMYALDAATGRIVWEFYLVPKQPGDPTRGPQGVSPLDTSSWDVAGDSPISGGATWTSYTLDPTTGLLYVPGGNPAPDFAATLRGGANLYTRFGGRARREDWRLSRSFQAHAQGLARLGRLQRARACHDRIGQARDARRAQGRLSLWLRPRHEGATLSGAGDGGRERRRPFLR